MTPKTLLLIFSDPTVAMMNWYQNIHHICGQNWSMLFISPSTKQYPTGLMVTTYIHSTKDVSIWGGSKGQSVVMALLTYLCYWNLRLTIQIAANAAIRSIANLPRRSAHISISSISQSLNIRVPSISDITEKLILTRAWKTYDKIAQPNQTGPTTRSHSQGNVPQPNQQGILAKMINTLSICAFNRLPLEWKLKITRKKPNISSRKCFKYISF